MLLIETNREDLNTKEMQGVKFSLSLDVRKNWPFICLKKFFGYSPNDHNLNIPHKIILDIYLGINKGDDW